MYGTIARLRPKRGKQQDVIAHLEEWKRTRGRVVDGYSGGYLFQPEKHPNELTLVVAFRDKKSYQANANDPEQDKWYRRLRDLLEADPSWEDGEVIDESIITREAGR